VRNDNRLQDALAHNRGRHILPVWIDEFQELTGHAVRSADFLDIHDTKRLKEAFFERIKAQTGCCVHEWYASDFCNVSNLLKRMNELIDSVEVVLFSDVDNNIGALRVQSSLVLSYADKLKDFLKEDLCFASEDLINGLCLEFNYYSDAGEYSPEGFYRLVAWGVFCRAFDKLTKDS